jgi:ATP adenylyltransferase
MSMPTLKPNTLLSALARQTAHALDCGALRPIETEQTTIDDAGVRFLVRKVSSLLRKAQARSTTASANGGTAQANGARPPFNPFLPHDPDLFVTDVSDTHIALLNKFNVIDHHLLIVTRRFVPQEALLDLDDFEAWLACLSQIDGLGFYNGGAAAGASQPHKHLQLVPLPLGDANTPLPIEALLDSAPARPGIVTVPTLPFAHAFVRFDSAAGTPTAQTALALYDGMLAALGIGATKREGHPQQSAPYNLLLTRRWMLLVPRGGESAAGISVNSLGFAGSFFVRDNEQMETLRRAGPMSVLARVALPRPPAQ